MMKHVLITYEVEGPESQAGREVERRVLAEGEVKWLCRAAWYLGKDDVTCAAATRARTGSPSGWPLHVHAKCGFVVVSPVELEEHEGVSYCRCGDEATAKVGPDQTPLCGNHLDQYVIQRKREDL